MSFERSGLLLLKQSPGMTPAAACRCLLDFGRPRTVGCVSSAHGFRGGAEIQSGNSPV